jgi:hypothetical protein
MAEAQVPASTHDLGGAWGRMRRSVDPAIASAFG